MARELVTLYFKRMDPGGGAGYTIEFPAYIKGLSDSISPDWATHTQMGRPDPVLMYSSWSRTISLSFVVLSKNKDEHKKNYESLSKLGRVAYPIMKASQGYNAPHLYFEIGNIHAGVGVIASIDFSWDTDTTWIDGRPVITNVDMSIRVLADRDYQRPNANTNKLFKIGDS